MKRMLAAAVLSLAAMAALVYGGDYLLLRYRVAAKRNGFGSVTVRSYYAVQEKNNRTEYIFKGTEDQTCVHALFAHLGYAPCWYLSRHPEKQITI